MDSQEHEAGETPRHYPWPIMYLPFVKRSCHVFKCGISLYSDLMPTSPSKNQGLNVSWDCRS